MILDFDELRKAKLFLQRYGRVDVNFNIYDDKQSVSLVVFPEQGLSLTIMFDGEDKPLLSITDNRDFDLTKVPTINRSDDYDNFFLACYTK